MGAVRTKTLADLRRRRLQSWVIGVILFLASGAATLALSVLVESHAPFDHAFASSTGAHLIVDYDGRVDRAQLEATGAASSVTASAGPWPVSIGALEHPRGRIVDGTFSGRPQSDPTIDNVTIAAGRWWQSAGEVVLDESTARLLDKRVGDTIAAYPIQESTGPKGAGQEPPPAAHQLTVVGIAGSVSTPDVAAWMSPTDIGALTPGGVPAQQMLYRVNPSATEGDLASALATISETLPTDAVAESRTYLDLKAGVEQIADLYVPVLLAFSIFALLAAAFTIANVVSGVVLTSYREIGVMKAIGYTPGQVTSILVAQIIVPVTIGAIGGVVVGTLASQPILDETALSFGLPTAFTLPLPVIAAVLSICFVTAGLAAIGPALRAGRLSAVTAITRGSAPSGRQDGGRLRRLGLALPVRLPVRLGVAAGLAHPLRAVMTLGALVVGVAALVFALGVDGSLLRLVGDLGRAQASPVRVELFDQAAEQPAPADVTAAIASDPNTDRFVSIGERPVTVPRAGFVPFVVYEQDSSWIGYPLIRGRWFTGPGEVVAPTNFFRVAGLDIGDVTTISLEGRSITVRLVGEIFDTSGDGQDNVRMRGAWADLASLDPSLEASGWEARPTAGVDPRDLMSSLQAAIGPNVGIYLEGDSDDGSFYLFLSVVGILGAVLVGMSLGGVFNTVLLETRQRTREMAILKAIGLTPRQTIGMVFASIVPVGLIAGLIGVPVGLVAQRAVLDYMGEVAAKTDIPPAAFDVFSPLMLIALGLAGLAIGAVGAYVPATRAARARIAPVLQAE